MALPLNPAAQLCFRKLSKASVVALSLEQFQLMPEGVICYQELEKVEMVPLQAEVAAFMMRSGTDVCVPKREDSLFRATYPVGQG